MNYPKAWRRTVEKRCPVCGVEAPGGRPCGYHKARERYERRKAALQVSSDRDGSFNALRTLTALSWADKNSDR